MPITLADIDHLGPNAKRYSDRIMNAVFASRTRKEHLMGAYLKLAHDVLVVASKPELALPPTHPLPLDHRPLTRAVMDCMGSTAYAFDLALLIRGTGDPDAPPKPKASAPNIAKLFKWVPVEHRERMLDEFLDILKAERAVHSKPRPGNPGPRECQNSPPGGDDRFKDARFFSKTERYSSKGKVSGLKLQQLDDFRDQVAIVSRSPHAAAIYRDFFHAGGDPNCLEKADACFNVSDFSEALTWLLASRSRGNQNFSWTRFEKALALFRSIQDNYIEDF